MAFELVGECFQSHIPSHAIQSPRTTIPENPFSSSSLAYHAITHQKTQGNLLLKHSEEWAKSANFWPHLVLKETLGLKLDSIIYKKEDVYYDIVFLALDRSCFWNDFAKCQKILKELQKRSAIFILCSRQFCRHSAKLSQSLLHKVLDWRPFV